MNILFITYNNSSYIHYFPLGVAYLASILRNQGHKVSIYAQDVNHYPEEHLTKYIEKSHFDIIGVGSVAGYYPYKKLLDISVAINNAKNRNEFLFMLGGHMVTPDSQYFMVKMKADIVLEGEADHSILDVCNSMKKGIYKSKIVENLDSLPMPAWDLFDMNYYRLQRMPNINNNEFSMSVISGRGCHWSCTFCYRMTKGIRLRSIWSIMEEITKLYKDYQITYIDFADDLTLASSQRTQELCEAILKLPFKIKWRCEGRLNFTKKEDLQLMKKSGCVFINYGIESLSDIVLKNIKKYLTKDQIIKGVELTLAEEISPGLNFMWGNVGDTEATLKESVDFLLKYDDCSQLRTLRFVTPYPGCELYYYAIEKGLIRDCADFYENKHVNSDLLTVNFTELDSEQMYTMLYNANKALITNYHQKRLYSDLKECEKLYLNKNNEFRGWRHT